MSARPALPRAARALLHALAAGPRLQNESDPEALAHLESHDLAMREGERVRITSAGVFFLRRMRAGADGRGDPFRRQHGHMETLSHGPDMNGAEVDAAESPLVWLARRRGRDGRPLIDTMQLQAGERLRADFTIGHMMPRTSSSWDGIGARGRGESPAGLHFSERTLAARQRVSRAMETVGPDFAGLLLDVCCFLKGLDDVERERSWPARSGKIALQLGLNALARHYGYATHAIGPRRQAVRRWSAAQDAEVMESPA